MSSDGVGGLGGAGWTAGGAAAFARRPAGAPCPAAPSCQAPGPAGRPAGLSASGTMMFPSSPVRSSGVGHVARRATSRAGAGSRWDRSGSTSASCRLLGVPLADEGALAAWSRSGADGPSARPRRWRPAPAAGAPRLRGSPGTRRCRSRRSPRRRSPRRRARGPDARAQDEGAYAVLAVSDEGCVGSGFDGRSPARIDPDPGWLPVVSTVMWSRIGSLAIRGPEPVVSPGRRCSPRPRRSSARRRPPRAS